MKLVAIARMLLVVSLLGPVAHADPYSAGMINGETNCEAVVSDGSNQTAQGVITLSADGKGHFTQGSATYTANNDDASNCLYSLRDGNYSIGRSGMVVAQTSWLLNNKGSAPSCTNLVASSLSFMEPSDGSFISYVGGQTVIRGTCRLP